MLVEELFCIAFGGEQVDLQLLVLVFLSEGLEIVVVIDGESVFTIMVEELKDRRQISEAFHGVVKHLLVVMGEVSFLSFPVVDDL